MLNETDFECDKLHDLNCSQNWENEHEKLNYFKLNFKI